METPTPHVRPTVANIIAILAAGIGSFVFGYANNVIAGTLVQTSFTEKFLSGDNASSIVGGVLGAFLGGGLLGAIAQAPISNKFGRRITTALAAVLVIVSGVLLAASYHIAQFIVGRVVSGLGAGIVIANCPVYMSEIAPPHIRGLMVGNHAISIVYGYILSAVTALAFHFVQAPYQWRLQFVLLTFFGLVLLASVVSLPESPRWLCEQGRYDEAWEVLKKLHQQADISDTTFATTEMSQIKAQIQAERSMPRGYMHIVRTPQLRHRAACSILVWIMGQSTGVLVIANLTAVIFGQLGFSVTLQLGLSVVWAVCALLGCFVNAALMDGIGRIKLLGYGGYLCSAVMICEAVLQKFYLGSEHIAGQNAAIALYFIFVFVYGTTVDCAAYVYVSEIWPTHLRSQGTTIGLVSFFACAIAYTSPAPVAFDQVGWRYYWVMISICIVSSTAIHIIAPETARLTLEEIDNRFGIPVGGTATEFAAPKPGVDSNKPEVVECKTAALDKK